ncbi:MAG TPA: hypothetical protein VGP72_06475 [Planctomycetota bacterium]
MSYLSEEVADFRRRLKTNLQNHREIEKHLGAVRQEKDRESRAHENEQSQIERAAEHHKAELDAEQCEREKERHERWIERRRSHQDQQQEFHSKLTEALASLDLAR